MLCETEQAIILKINDRKYITQITKELGLNYLHTLKNIKKLENKGLLMREVQGRNKVLKLSLNGYEVKKYLMRISNVLKNAGWKK